MRTIARRALAVAGQVSSPANQTYEFGRAVAFKRLKIDAVLDVGANSGQYAKALRHEGFAEHIVSIEPLPAAFQSLRQAMENDPKWTGYQVAAGEEPSIAKFNVSIDSVCSSLLQPTHELTAAIPSAKIAETIDVPVTRLDDLVMPVHKRLAIKIDVQGFEKLLSEALLLELELPLTPSYQGAYLLQDAIPHILECGFKITSIGRGYSNPNTGRLVDVDVLFERAS
jgi:FkbM family methyltransferase